MVKDIGMRKNILGIKHLPHFLFFSFFFLFLSPPFLSFSFSFLLFLGQALPPPSITNFSLLPQAHHSVFPLPKSFLIFVSSLFSSINMWSLTPICSWTWCFGLGVFRRRWLFFRRRTVVGIPVGLIFSISYSSHFPFSNFISFISSFPFSILYGQPLLWPFSGETQGVFRRILVSLSLETM